ncbi:hypothetical protein KI688_007849 [Linnemannia hyalina]|uniref:Uncharacterized protein n=1 Tax=Linnemannia hyalina TaxID=64524 RepID=A0A9P8BMB9_9FUNG|nr:hypothetical protein KI688_007849 [Linnemannia hyalina]
MNDAQQRYLEETPAKKYSIIDWALLSDSVDVDMLELTWTRTFLKHLKNSPQQDKLEAYRRLSKMSVEDKMASFSPMTTDVSISSFNGSSF